MERFICQPDAPVVETEEGKLRGYQWNGTYVFKGIRYAQARRFHRPEKPEAFEGVRDAQSYGVVCPLLEQDRPGMELLVPHIYWPMDEHCQYLNIWTQSLDRTARKPVMVWLHGGGFFAGSSIEQVAYDGENMSRCGDVVVVSLNHRLNVLGYLDLSPFGEEYADSANLGNFDIIAALSWIRNNIAGFGGDPENVTIFGQSGGGAKVWTLMQMPEADGLYQKAIVQSGVYEMLGDAEEHDGAQLVEAMLQELGLDRTEVQKLETIPYEELARAYRKAAPAIREMGGYVGCEPHIGAGYAGDPLRHGFREQARKIPLLIGTVLGEFDFHMPLPGKRSMSEKQAAALVEEAYGEEGKELLALFRKAYPDKQPVELLKVDTLFRIPTLRMIEERARGEGAPTYSYQFTYTFPLFDGKIAWHCSEIPFVFHNIDKVPVCGGTEEAEKLQDVVFGAWMSFARTGRPEIAGTDWPACAPGDEPVMILDTDCEIRHNVDHELLARISRLKQGRSEDYGEIQH